MADTSFLTWPFFDDHHRTLASDLTAWCEAELTAPHDEHDIDGQCRDLLERLARGGWLRYAVPAAYGGVHPRSEEHTSELQSLMRNLYAVFCLKKTTTQCE